MGTPRGPYRHKPIEPRFWSKVRLSEGCWEWNGATVRRYGVLNVDHRLVYAHRLSWEWINGPIPAGMNILHRCDNPPCVRPDHLFAGSQMDNIRDAAGKFRTSHGEQRPNHRTTDVQVLEMRRLHAAGMTVAEMAHRYPISQRTIRKIIARKNWRHL